MFSTFGKALASVIFAGLIFPYSANAQRQVDVTGVIDCDGIYSESCGWGPYGPGGDGGYGGNGPGGGSDSGGGGESAGGSGAGSTNWEVDDKTRGKAPVNRYTPGCMREQLFLESVKADAANRNPPGIVIMDSFNDPAYSDVYWVKMSADRVDTFAVSGATYKIEKRMETHYMYNRFTFEVGQVKLKNSFEWGCTGIAKPI